VSSSNSVFEKFRDRFRPGYELREEEEAGEIARLVEVNRESVADMRVFIGTAAYGDFRSRLEGAIRANRPNVSEGQDVTLCKTYKNDGLQTAIDILDEMVRLAEEKAGNV